VVDHDSARPLAGVTVAFELEYFGLEATPQERLTDNDGRTAIEFETADLKRLAYHLPGPDLVAPRGEWLGHQAALIPATFEVQVSPGVEIGGTVVDQAGRPAVGAEVLFDRSINVIFSGADHPIRNRMWTATAGERLATTDTTGAWSARRMYPGGRWAALRVRHPDFADAVYSTDVTKEMEAEGEQNALDFDELAAGRTRFTLSPGVSLSGSVLGPDGTPRPGARIRFGDWRDVGYQARAAVPFEREVRSDDAGRFETGPVAERPVYLAAQPTGYALIVRALDLRQPAGEIVLQLERGQGLRGLVIDPEQNPVGGAHVRLTDWGMWRGVRWETVTDAEGRFQWAEAPAERFRIQIHDPRDPDAFSHGRYIATFNEPFEVPDTGQRDSREPFDIGVFDLTLKPQIEEGITPAPQFTTLDLEGRAFALGDFAGKHVLLDFWATWCVPCLAELPYLHEAQNGFMDLELSG
jgi:hypothetical protein